MRVDEILVEGVASIFGRDKGKIVRKYRCTTGSRKGRIVASPSTCNAPKRVKSSVSLKRTKAKKGSVMKVKSSRTKKHSGASPRIARLNRQRIKPTRRTSKRKRIK